MILVTGVAGFIGSNLLDILIDKKERILGVDNLSVGSLENIKNFSKNKSFRFMKTDILSKEFLKIRNISTIFHLASLIDARESVESPRKYFLSIVVGTMNVLESARRNDAKVVFTSSAAVYGNYRRKVKETDKPKPVSPYGMFKLMAEKLVRNYSKMYGLNYTIFRLFNVYGENARRGIIKILLDSSKTGKPFHLFGDGTQKRDFIYVKDVCKILANHHKLNKDTFNVGTGKATSIIELVNLVQKISRGTLKIIRKPKARGDIDYSCANNSKLLSKIKIDFTSVEEGLRLLVRKSQL